VKTIDDIRLEIDASRRAIRTDYAALRGELDFAAKAKRVIAKRPLPWLGGAAFLGFLLSGRKKVKVYETKGGKGKPTVKSSKGITVLSVLLGAARLIFPLVRPQLTALALSKLTDLSGKFSR